jgi:hypothetical protein
MLIAKPLSFVSEYIETVNQGMKEYRQQYALSRTQSYWLAFCITAIFITNSVCWARFERAGMGKYSLPALSWMFRHTKIAWNLLFHMSAKVIMLRYGIQEGCLAIDDSHKRRSKTTTRISNVHKIKDKTSGGYIMGQSLVFVVLITPQITIPVGFSFYMPDPELSAWNKQNQKLKKLGIPRKKRPSKPAKNKNYPTMQEIALNLLEEFKSYHPHIKIKSVFADALYGTGVFLDKASKIFGGVQVISQLRNNQNICYKNKKQSVNKYFSIHIGVPQTIKVRGDKEVRAIIGSARLHVNSHGKKRFVIALKYEGEKDYRYLVATDLSWRTLDIVQAYTLRWLIEVFLQDWKSNEGWGTLTKQPGEEGSSRSLILSLLADHCLFLHPEQSARLENKLPVCTVGSLRSQIKVESLLTVIRELLSSDDPEAQINQMVDTLKKYVFTLAPSKKHMANRDLGRLEPTPSLKYKMAACRN